MELVLAIDNIVFISILVDRVAPGDRTWVRRVGIAGALVTRLGLLFALATLMKLTAPIATIAGIDFSGRDLILFGGGVFLFVKAAHELAPRRDHGRAPTGAGGRTAWLTVLQIMLIDVVFSLDSVITAVGMAGHLWVMIAAMVIAVAVMLAFARPIGELIARRPSLKVLALAFLLLVGAMLAAEGLGRPIGRGYLYAAAGFALLVELLQLTRRPAPGP